MADADSDRAIALATRLRSEGRLKDAQAIYQRQLAAHPHDARALAGLAGIAREMGHDDQAAILFERATDTDPDLPEAWTGLAALHERKGAEYKAVAAREKARMARTRSLLKDYGRQLESFRRSPYVDYPAFVDLETLASCSGRCGFCAWPDLDRKGARLTDALIDKILCDLADIPGGIPLQINPTGINEPFMDDRLPDILARIEARLPDATINLSTNGMYLTAAAIDTLASLARPGTLWVSVNARTARDRMALMGLDFETVLNGLYRLAAARADNRLKMHVILTRVMSGGQEDEAFLDWARARFPAFQAALVPRGGYFGAASTGPTTPPRIGCGRWFGLFVNALGQVPICSMDARTAYPMGDAAAAHLLDIYNRPEARAFRLSAAGRSERDPCRNCAAL